MSDKSNKADTAGATRDAAQGDKEITRVNWHKRDETVEDAAAEANNDGPSAEKPAPGNKDPGGIAPAGTR